MKYYRPKNYWEDKRSICYGKRRMTIYCENGPWDGELVIIDGQVKVIWLPNGKLKHSSYWKTKYYTKSGLEIWKYRRTEWNRKNKPRRNI